MHLNEGHFPCPDSTASLACRPNILPALKVSSSLARFAREFKNGFAILLLVASVLSFIAYAVDVDVSARLILLCSTSYDTLYDPHNLAEWETAFGFHLRCHRFSHVRTQFLPGKRHQFAAAKVFTIEAHVMVDCRPGLLAIGWQRMLVCCQSKLSFEETERRGRYHHGNL